MELSNINSLEGSVHTNPEVVFFVTASLLVAWLSNQLSQKVKAIPAVVWMLVLGMCVNVVISAAQIPQTEVLVSMIRGDHPSDLIVFGFMLSGCFIMFLVGLETNFSGLLEASKIGLPVAMVGVAIPMILVGGATAYLMGYGVQAAFGAAGVASATSVAIGAATLEAKRVRRTEVGSIVMAAAVLDDIFGIGILQAVIGFAGGGGGGHNDATLAQKLLGYGFFIGFVFLGQRWGGAFFRAMGAWMELSLELVLLIWMTFFVGVAILTGLEPILGAYSAGVTCDEAFVAEPGTDPGVHKPVEHFFVTLQKITMPFFFVVAMCMINPIIFLDGKVMGMGALFTVLFVVGKLFAGLPAKEKLVTGVAMVPRGEMGIIFASTCLSAGILPPDLFGALMVAILGSTLIGAIALGPVIDWVGLIERLKIQKDPEAPQDPVSA